MIFFSLPFLWAVVVAAAVVVRKGVIHQDVKPDNIMVHKASTPWMLKLTDFGLSVRGKIVSSTKASAMNTSTGGVGNALSAHSRSISLPGVKSGVTNLAQRRPIARRLTDPHEKKVSFLIRSDPIWSGL